MLQQPIRRTATAIRFLAQRRVAAARVRGGTVAEELGEAEAEEECCHDGKGL